MHGNSDQQLKPEADAAAAGESGARERQLAAEVRALTRLHEASSRLWGMRSLDEGLNEMLAATMELLGADFGNVQLYDARRGVLTIAVQSGFGSDFLDAFREVGVQDDTACGRALRGGQPVLIEDIETDAPFAPFRPIARAAGHDFRALPRAASIGRGGTTGRGGLRRPGRRFHRTLPDGGGAQSQGRAPARRPTGGQPRYLEPRPGNR